jgi:acetyl-CoA carboxylase carboxyl transferase subunit alpha
VISPEGCAAILWKDRSAAARAAEALKITARHLKELGLIDEVIPEPLGGAHNDHAVAAESLKTALTRHLEELLALTAPDRLQKRYHKFRNFGQVMEKQNAANGAAPA